MVAACGPVEFRWGFQAPSWHSVGVLAAYMDPSWPYFGSCVGALMGSLGSVVGRSGDVEKASGAFVERGRPKGRCASNFGSREKCPPTARVRARARTRAPVEMGGVDLQRKRTFFTRELCERTSAVRHKGRGSGKLKQCTNRIQQHAVMLMLAACGIQVRGAAGDPSGATTPSKRCSS